MNPSMIWHRTTSARWSSSCGRYTAAKARTPTGGLVLCLYFYGFLVLRQHHECIGDDLPASARRCAEQHRQRALPLVCEFERWASDRYHTDIARMAIGPTLLNWPGDRHAGQVSIDQRFAAIYRSISPEPRDGAKDQA